MVDDDGQAQEGARERRSKMVADVIAIQWYSMRDCQRMMVQWWLCLSRHQFPSMPQLQQGRDYLGCIAMWLSVHSNFRERVPSTAKSQALVAAREADGWYGGKEEDEHEVAPAAATERLAFRDLSGL